MRRASSAFCSTISTLTPIAFTFLTRSKTSLMYFGDRPAEGSSNIRTLGRTLSAQAKASI